LFKIVKIKYLTFKRKTSKAALTLFTLKTRPHAFLRRPWLTNSILEENARINIKFCFNIKTDESAIKTILI